MKNAILTQGLIFVFPFLSFGAGGLPSSHLEVPQNLQYERSSGSSCTITRLADDKALSDGQFRVEIVIRTKARHSIDNEIQTERTVKLKGIAKQVMKGFNHFRDLGVYGHFFNEASLANSNSFMYVKGIEGAQVKDLFDHYSGSSSAAGFALGVTRAKLVSSKKIAFVEYNILSPVTYSAPGGIRYIHQELDIQLDTESYPDGQIEIDYEQSRRDQGMLKAYTPYSRWTESMSLEELLNQPLAAAAYP